MVDDVLSNAAGGILEKVLLLAASEIVNAWGFKKDLNMLRGSFEMIEAVLQDAESQLSTRKAVKLWFKKLKEVAGEADDLLDEIHYEMLRRNIEIKNQMTKVSSFFSTSNSVIFQLKMGHKIKHINTRLAEINKEAIAFGLQREGEHPHQLRVNQETDSFVDKFEIVGRENDASKLVQSLIGSQDEKILTVIPIVGMGGLGKTTLAKLIYNDDQVKSHFDARVWVCVSGDIDVRLLLAKLLKSLTEMKCEAESMEFILQNLQESLGRKKYLLVLDDMWNHQGCILECWDDFTSCMSKINRGHGNSIIITTRSIEVASICRTSVMHVLGGLSDEHCWSIIEERTFDAGGPPKFQELVDIGIEIAKMCIGVPLVAKVVGGILHSKENKAEWLSFQNNGVWALEVGDRVMSILKLSFDNLPSTLIKQCFAYCSIFQKDQMVGKEQLIQLWMALGFLQEDEARNKDMEDVGDDFFKILVQNSLFQDVVKDSCDNIIGCIMHDLVHDLAHSLSNSECFNSRVSTSSDIIPQVRHLALYSGGERIFSVLKEKEKARYLQTLFLNDPPKNLALKFKCLRILNLSYSGLETLPDSVGEMIHLRYLDLSWNHIKLLPKSVGRLYLLQTLRLNEPWSLLKELPREVKNLVSLRHLYIDESCNTPVEVGKLTCLHSLRFFHVGREKGHRIQELGCLKLLSGELCISNLEEVISKEEAQAADLVAKMKLNRLEYIWSSDRKGATLNDKDILEGLQPCPILKSINIDGFMGDNFPEWVMKMAVSVNGKQLPLHNLVEITLSRCNRCERVPMLGQMPLLRKLVLETMPNLKCIDGFFYGSQCHANISSDGGGKPVFLALRYFTIRNMPKLEVWMDVRTKGASSIVVFPCLEELYIDNCGINMLPYQALWGARLSLKYLSIKRCPNLKIIPTFIGFSSLLTLLIWSCEGLASLPSDLLGSCTSLVHLRIIYCNNLLSLPGLHDQNHSLQELQIFHCKRLCCLPEGLTGLNVLKVLSHGSFPEDLQSYKLGLKPVLLKLKSSLRKLQLIGRPYWDSIPDEIQYLTVLTSIDLNGFGVEALPDWFGNLSSLESILLSNCKKLRSLPSMNAMQQLTRLNSVYVVDCPLLKGRDADESSSSE